MKTVLIITPDSILHPCGGLGVYLQETIKRFPKDYRFLIIGTGFNTEKTHSGSNYFYTSLANMNELQQSAILLKQCSLIHCMDAGTFEIGLKIKKALKIPLVVHIHLSETLLVKDLGVPYYNEELKNAELKGLSQADHVIHVSKKYSFRFPTYKPTSVVWNGINKNDFTRKPKVKFSLPGNPNNRKIVFIGRFTLQKGIQNLIKCAIPSNVNVYLVGGSTGSQPDLTKAVIDFASKAPNVFYLGAKWGDEKLSIIQQCDSMIVPSVHEPFGIVALEAIASNKLLISSYADGMSDFLRPFNSLYCGKTVQELQQALNQFSVMSPGEIEQKKNLAKQLLPHFTWNSTVQKLLNIYSKLQNKQPYEKSLRIFR